MIVEIIGWVATFFTLYSFTLNDVVKLRIVNSIGSIIWMVYGIQTHTMPTIVVNLCVLIIHLVWFVKNLKIKITKLDMLLSLIMVLTWILLYLLTK